MTLEQRIAVLEEIFAKLQDYYTSAYSGEEIDARLASAGVPIGITKEYKSVTEMNQDFTGADVQRGQFVLILPDSTASADYGKVYLKGTANWVYAFTLTTLTSIKGPIGPPGKKGDKGDPGEAGSSFVILGYFDTLDALKAAVPNPKAGDVYGVGTAPPYNIYIWDSVHGKWVPNGNLQGPQGKQGIQGPEGKRGPEGKQGPEGPVGGSSNFVRYDAPQNLTDEQKAQARTNIGADTVQGAVLYTPQTLSDAQKAQARKNINSVPGGFGWGEAMKDVLASDAKDTYETYCGKLDMLLADMPDGTSQLIYTRGPVSTGQYSGAGNIVAVLSKILGTSASLIGLSPDPRGTTNGLWRMLKDNGNWQPVEWINPPMELGTEYRTTERYLGKPVYVKAVNFGVVPNNSAKAVNHGIANLDVCFMVYGHDTLNHRPIPTMCLSGNITEQVGITVDGSNIIIHTTFDANNDGAIVVLKYTKTTD
jgi:hypothetical protein